MSGEDYTYLVTVLRKRIGDELMVNFDNEKKCLARIIKIDSSSGEIFLQQVPRSEEAGSNEDLGNSESQEASNVAGGRIVLLQWLIKGPKMDTVVRQATEAGVSEIIPIYGVYSVVRNEDENNKFDRRNRIIREARQQSGSSVQTKLQPAMSLEKALEYIESQYGHQKNALWFSEKVGGESLHKVLNKDAKVTIIAIGAEGGFSPSEVSEMMDANF